MIIHTQRYTNHRGDEMDKRKRVCIIVPAPFPSKGGLENLITDLVLALSKKGCMIDVVCTKLGEGYIPDGIRIYPILRGPKIKYIGFVVGMILKLILFYNFLRKEKPQIIHAHSSFPSGFIALSAKLLDIPVICTSHGSDIQVNREVGYGERQNRVIAMLVNIALKHSSLHTVVSKTMIKDAIEAGSHPSKIRVVYNGINLDKIPSFGVTDILPRYGITKDDFIVLYLGRLHPKKCPDDLVKAFPKVVKKVPNAKLIFAGKGEEETKLKRLVSDLSLNEKVIFAGFISEDEKWDLLKSCDVFVLPSVVEGHPITVIEAMACHKAVIATDVGPFPEVIKNGETGLLVSLHSPEDLADAMIELAIDEDKKITMGKKARKDVEERFDINKIADEYLALYEELIDINKKKQ
jgi:glycosyltransferase involved in cell wall biosynthesis